MSTLTYLQAISAGLREELRADERVFVMGEDIGVFGGAFKVVAPATAEDAKGLLHTAIHDPNPVVYMEHKHLYRRIKGDVPDGVFETPLTARVAQPGSDLVVIAYGAMVHTALEAVSDGLD